MTQQEIDLAVAECWIHARYWEDSMVNGVEDDAENPKMPLVEEHFAKACQCGRPFRHQREKFTDIEHDYLVERHFATLVHFYKMRIH